MKTGLVVRAVEESSPKLINRPIIPPNKEAHSALEKIRADNKSPKTGAEDILRGELPTVNFCDK
jgi:hypothetical protein